MIHREAGIHPEISREAGIHPEISREAGIPVINHERRVSPL